MKVAILGTAPASRGLAPFSDSTWDIWACSPGNKDALPRVTVWFELHSVVDMISEEHKPWSLPYFNWLAGQPFPVYMQEKNDLVPRAIPYPRDGMIKLFGRNWFTSSIAYMLALAISQMRPGDEIALFGVDMAAGEEHYTAQRAGLVRFMEIARERGIVVHVPFESCLGKAPPMYGYSENTHFGRHLNVRRRQIKAALAQLEGQYAKLGQEICYAKGALEQIEYDIRTWPDGADADIGGSEVVTGEAPKAPLVDFSKFRPHEVPGGVEGKPPLLVPIGTDDGAVAQPKAPPPSQAFRKG